MTVLVRFIFSVESDKYSNIRDTYSGQAAQKKYALELVGSKVFAAAAKVRLLNAN